MIDHALVAGDAMRLLDATGMYGGKPVLLVGKDEDQRLTMAALAESASATPINLNVTLAQALIDAAGTRVDLGAVIAAMEPTFPILLLDRIQLLMLPQLRTNAIDVLCRVARRRAVCASWPGQLGTAACATPIPTTLNVSTRMRPARSSSTCRSTKAPTDEV